MKIIIIGAVAAGTSAAAKARRNSETAEIKIYEKDSYISYSGCGMPYFLSGQVGQIDDLAPRDPEFFKSKYNVDIFTRHEVSNINPIRKFVTVKNLGTGEVFEDSFDKLVVATGAKSVIPPIPGAAGANVFALRNINDLIKISDFITKTNPQNAAIIGTGFIGLEMCENLVSRGIALTLIEKLPQVAQGLDAEMAAYVQEHIESHGVRVLTSANIVEITPSHVMLSDGEKIPAELVIMATGVRPEVGLANTAGIELGTTGAIKVNAKMQTNFPDIYACGDCIEQFQISTGRPIYRPLGSTANKTGRIAGDSLTGGDLEFKGILGTGIFRVFEMAVAQTGLTEREAIEEGFDVATCINIKPSKPEYMGGKEMVIKAVAEKGSGRLLGAQIVGEDGVDKRIDVFVTAISFGATVGDLAHLDLAYAPPFSTTKDPVMYTGMILENAIHRGRPLMTATELEVLNAGAAPGAAPGAAVQVIDARAASQFAKGHLGGAESIPLEHLRAAIDTLDKDATTVTYCNKGTTGNAAQNVLLNSGFKHVYNLSGGHKHSDMNRKGPI